MKNKKILEILTELSIRITAIEGTLDEVMLIGMNNRNTSIATSKMVGYIHDNIAPVPIEGTLDEVMLIDMNNRNTSIATSKMVGYIHDNIHEVLFVVNDIEKAVNKIAGDADEQNNLIIEDITALTTDFETRTVLMNNCIEDINDRSVKMSDTIENISNNVDDIHNTVSYIVELLGNKQEG